MSNTTSNTIAKTSPGLQISHKITRLFLALASGVPSIILPEIFNVQSEDNSQIYTFL